MGEWARYQCSCGHVFLAPPSPTCGKCGGSDLLETITEDVRAEPEKPRNWKHDCEDWAMEGVACAKCNPMAKGAREALEEIRDDEHPSTNSLQLIARKALASQPAATDK